VTAALGNAEFYSAAAQVLPVLFLIAAVEFRLFVLTPEEVKRWGAQKMLNWQVGGNVLAVTLYVVTVGLGEGAALHALHTEDTTPNTDAFVIGALIASGVVAIVSPMLAILSVVEEHDPQSGWTKAYDPVAWVVLAAVAAMPLYALFTLLG
jgi:hypothetical protein